MWLPEKQKPGQTASLPVPGNGKEGGDFPGARVGPPSPTAAGT